MVSAVCGHHNVVLYIYLCIYFLTNRGHLSQESINYWAKHLFSG